MMTKMLQGVEEEEGEGEADLEVHIIDHKEPGETISKVHLRSKM